MTDTPRYPEDAAAGSGPRPEVPSPNAPPAIERAVAADKAESGSRGRLVTGAAIGIGSAALVAALLYARSRGRNEKKPSVHAIDYRAD